ncbi:MAG: Crp/Fnr family transcriptional regulator [Bacteroidales bacterium]|jgi:CRP-like cAMP-binding protein|nr:Crp/Fnr family transcriptional regulator [Bacteroidales bacterium]
MYNDKFYLEILKNKNSVFSDLSDTDKETLFNHHSCNRYKKGEIIFKEGNRPTALICLVEGKVKIFKEGVGGREQIVRLARPGGFIGYRALFAKENYLASAIAIEESIVCSIDKEDLYHIMENNVQICLKILQMTATELGMSNTRTVSLTQKHIRGRLAESLLFLIETYSFEDDNSTIKAYLSREDIANLSNMTTSNAIRTLSTFAGEKVISLDGRRIKILNLSKLRKISELG